jgi:AcrR family transcriptional regulator
MVRVARQLGVATALIHYYVGSREQLTSGIINRSFRRLVGKLPKPSISWRRDAELLAHTAYEHFLEFRGIPAYLSSHNRFRVVQLVGPGEADYGVAFFDAVADLFRRAGLPPAPASIAVHLYLQFLLASAYAAASRQLPGDHNDYLGREFERLAPRAFPGIHHIKTTFATLRADEAFAIGMKLLLDGIEKWAGTRRRRQ